jgi:UDP-2-acetamido-3-amino-2,3-dideoxy-glucuronate N-acetyltransferase
MTQIALIGIGYWGDNLLRAFNSLEKGEITRVCDNDKNKLAQIKRRYSHIKCNENYAHVLKDKNINAIVIATPAATHYELAKQALERDKDVFVEKPLAMSTKDAKYLIRLAEKRQKIIMVGHVLRYHPAVLKLAEIISKGVLGEIQYIYSNRLNIGKLRIEENILWSFAPHDISVILMLAGEDPVKISAFGGDYLNRGIYDITLTTLEFKNGVKSHVFVSWLHPYKEQKLVVVGSKSMAVFDDVSEEKLFIYPHKIEWLKGIPVAHKVPYHAVKISRKEPLLEEANHFVDCVVNRKKPKTDGYEALKVLKVLEMAEKSLKRKKHNHGRD